MFRRLIVRSLLPVALLLPLAATPLDAQEARRGGPPPEIRSLVDAFLAALNSGNADTWEAMAKERFSAEFLKKRPAAERKELFEKLRKDFGTVSFERAVRQGPDAPLELQVKGSTGATGTIALEIDGASPPRISGINVNIGGKDDQTVADGLPPPPINGRMSAGELDRALDAYLSKLAAEDVFSGVALVARNDVSVFHKAYGLADRASRIPNTVRTRFNIASINKTFTRMAIDQLASQGKLAYTDTLGKFFPEYPQAVSRTATIQQLLSHTAGLADFFGPEFTAAAKDRFRSNADYFQLVGSLAPRFAPGAQNQYCNGCYIALGAIVERVSGMPYEAYVAEHIFKRADMTSTGYPHVDAIEPDVAVGYTRRTHDGQLRSNVYMHGATGSAAGGGYSTAMDLFAYVKAIRQGKLPAEDRGMGIAGGAPGMNAAIESDDEWTVIVLTNLDPPTGSRVGVGILRALRSQS